MNKISKSTSPALRLPDRTSVVQPRFKANVFADCFLEKWALPAESENEYTVLPPAVRGDDDFVVVRTRRAAAVLRDLRDDSATGPDSLPARILRTCSKQLSLPFVKLARVILRAGEWPRCWCSHWTVSYTHLRAHETSAHL
eukprot:5396925-Alexandrium_andersonii.AAC.1